jgi:exonuclease SbcD
MRFLHTGDWHVGRTLRGRSRNDEYAGALDQLVAIAVDESVDAVLVAGDVYDQRSVTPEADELIFETFLRLHAQRIPVVVIPGNHDSPARLNAFAPLLRQIDTTVVAKMLPPGHGGTVEITSKSSERALVSCLPFVSPRRFATATMLFDDVAATYTEFDRGMQSLLSAYSSGFEDDAVNVVLGHMFVTGARPGGGEREVTLGSDFAVSPAHLPATAHYVALGHIHRPQRIAAAPGPARYCGSLIQLDFGERNQDKSVVVVDARPGRRAAAKEIPITAGRSLIDLEGTLDDLEVRARDITDEFLRVTVKVDRPVPGIADRVRDLLGPNTLDVRLDYERVEERDRVAVRGLDPRDQFIAYYRDNHGVEPADELLGAFDRVSEEVAG